MDFHARHLSRRSLALALLLACGLAAHAEPALEDQQTPLAAVPAVTAKPASKPSPDYSKATLSAFEPDPAQLVPRAETAPGPALSAASLLSPVVAMRPEGSGADAAPRPVGTEPGHGLVKLMEPDQAPSSVPKTRQLPSQEEGAALRNATALPVAGEQGQGVSEAAQTKVEKGIDTGPINLRVKKQALQMSVEFPLGSP